MNVQIFGGNNPNDGPNCLYIVTLNMGQAGWAACAVFENKSTLIKVENQSWIVMSGRRCWDGGPRQCLLSPPPRSNTAQPSQPGQAELRMNECWAGLAQPHCSTQHTRATDYRATDYRATELQSTLTTLSYRVIQQSGSDRSSPAALHAAV